MNVVITSVIAVIMQCSLTVGIVAAWRIVKRNNPLALPKIFFVSTIVRLLFSLVLFALGAFFTRNNTDDLKIFAVVFIAIYCLLLLVDTAYFYCSSQIMNKK